MNAHFEILEQRVGTHETARFPFFVDVDKGEARPSVDSFRIECDDERFDASWATIVSEDASPPNRPHYSLCAKVVPGGAKPYGQYVLRLSTPPSLQPTPLPECLFIVQPCIHVKHRPVLKASADQPVQDQSAQLTLSVANCGAFDCSVSVRIHHHGSQWSQQWSFDLSVDAGPFDFSEEVTLPSGRTSADFDLTISAEDFPISTYRLRPRKRILSRSAKGALIGASTIVLGVATTVGLMSTTGGSQPSTTTTSTTSTPTTSTPTTSTPTTSTPTTSTTTTSTTTTSTTTTSTTVPVTVPNVLGDSLRLANATLSAAGLQVGNIDSACSDTFPAETVSGENPTAGSSVPPQSAVNLVTSTGGCLK